MFDGVCSLASLYRAPFISFRNPVSSKRSYHFSTVSVYMPSLRAKESRVADRVATLWEPVARRRGGERERERIEYTLKLARFERRRRRQRLGFFRKAISCKSSRREGDSPETKRLEIATVEGCPGNINTFGSMSRVCCIFKTKVRSKIFINPRTLNFFFPRYSNNSSKRCMNFVLWNQNYQNDQLLIFIGNSTDARDGVFSEI